MFQIYSKKLRTLCGVALLCCTQSFAQNVEMDWVNSIPTLKDETNSYDVVKSVVADAAGNVYVTGYFNGKIDLDPGMDSTMLQSQGEFDAFIAKYGADGKLIWGKGLHVPSTVEFVKGTEIAVDHEGNVYTTGQFTGSLDLDPGPNFDLHYAPVGGWLSYTYVCKLDKEGNYLWGRTLSGNPSSTSAPISIKIDKEGQAFIYGGFSGPITFDPSPGAQPVNVDMPSAYLLKLAKDGKFVWVKVTTGTGAALPSGMCLAPSGNIYMIMNFWMGYGATSSMELDPNSDNATVFLEGMGEYCVYKYNKEGKFEWGKKIKTTGMAFAYGLGLTSKEDVVITGQHGFGDTYFDPATDTFFLSSPSSLPGVVTSLDVNGKHRWTRAVEGTILPSSLSVDAADNIFTTGYFSDTLDFDPSVGVDRLSSLGSSNCYVWKLNKDGIHKWSKMFKDKRYVSGVDIFVDGHGSVYTTGFFSGECDFDPNGKGKFRQASVGDMFIHKMICTDTNVTLINADIRCGDTYDFFGTPQKESGVYRYQQLVNSAGCDSIIVLDLKVQPLDAFILIDEFVLKTDAPYHSYQWLKDGQLIDGATDSIYTITGNGKYQVIVGNGNGCWDTTEVYLIENSAINNFTALGSQIMIYPNPAIDLLHISNAPEYAQIILSDILGKQVLSCNDQKNISIGHLSPGIYFITVKSEDGLVLKTQKFVKKQVD